MDADARIEQALEVALDRAADADAPPILAAAMRHAVFPGGARLRPRLCLAVAAACGDDNPAISDAAAAAIELLHCASLVHDDLPCFDDAEHRRGKPSVHCAFGQPIAVLTGDALIVMAFEVLARETMQNPMRVAGVISSICRGVGMPHGIVAGQAQECEPAIEISKYHRAKTGALFEAAAAAGAKAAGGDHRQWSLFGAKLGEACQVVDDIRDVASCAKELGKPTCRDELLGRPNAALLRGAEGAKRHADQLIADGLAAIPERRVREAMRNMVMAELGRLMPRTTRQAASV
ncbi:MAG: polyprenyl synthetase family protein [Hyphomicrobiaceae bacterium]